MRFFLILVALNALPNFLADPYAPGSGKAAPHHRCTIHLNCEESHMLDKAFQQGQQGLIPDRFHTYVNAAYIGIIIIYNAHTAAIKCVAVNQHESASHFLATIHTDYTWSHMFSYHAFMCAVLGERNPTNNS